MSDPSVEERECAVAECHAVGGPLWIAQHERGPHATCEDCGRLFSEPGLVVHRHRHHPPKQEGTNERVDRPFRRVRSTATIMAELEEQERLIQLVRERWSHAVDLAFSTGSGPGGGQGRSDIAYSDTTGNTASDQRKQYLRERLGSAGS